MRLRALTVTAVWVCAASVRAEPAPPQAAAAVSPARRVLAIGVAVIPGSVLRGTGSYVLGTRTPTAKRLAKLGAIGLGGMIVAGIPIGVTGAPPVLSIPGVPVILAGASLYVPTWFADIWVASGLDRYHGFARTLPPYSLEVGTSWATDPFRELGLARAAGRLELGRLGLGAAGMVDAAGDHETIEASVAWRLLGRGATAEVTPDTSRLGVRVTQRRHRDDTDDVTTLTTDLEVVGRYDLVRVDPILEGTFLDAALGFGLERASYGRDAGVDAADWSGLTLGRLAWGAYLFDRGEAQIFYNHRRDDLVGGLAAARLSGFVGYVGSDVVLPVTGPWMIRASLEIGNAWVSTLALRYHGGLR